MISFVVLAILIVLLGVVLMQLFKKPPAPAAAPKEPDLANLNVTDARRGDMISIAGAGDNLSDLDFTIDHVHRLLVGAWGVRLLSGLYRERRITVRITEGEDAEVSVDSDPRKLTIDGLGLAEEDLAEMDERQNPADSFEFDGKVWLYRRSREAQDVRDEGAQRSAYYYWEFEEQDGNRLLTISKPEGEPFAVRLYTRIPTGDITVFRGSTAS
jgi:hypothetical protein